LLRGRSYAVIYNNGFKLSIEPNKTVNHQVLNSLQCLYGLIFVKQLCCKTAFSLLLLLFLFLDNCHAYLTYKYSFHFPSLYRVVS